MPTCRTGLVAGLIFIVLMVQAAPAQQVIAPQAPPRDRVGLPRTGTGVIKGHVIDGATGAAVARARVTVMAGPLRSSVVTDGSGTFVFTNLPPGPLAISIDKPTFLSTRYPTPGRTIRSNSQPLVLGDGQTIDNISIPMFHGGAIAGRVLDANGDLLENAQVTALRIPSSGRIGRSTMRSGSSSDDRGEFRIGRLEPGTYLLQVVYRRQMNQPEETLPGAAPIAPPPQPLPTFYPNALSADQAQPITVGRGQTVGDVDVMLSEGYPGVVNGVVTTTTGAALTDMNVFVTVRPVPNEPSGISDGYSSGTSVRPDGTFRVTLPPGEYQIEAHAMPRNNSGPPMRQEDELMGSVKGTVASGAEDAMTITVGRGATATGRVVFEGTAPPPASPGKTRLPLYSENGMCRSGDAIISADWTFRIEGLFGTCSTPPYATFGRWMLKSVTVDGENVADVPFTFQTGQQFRNVQVVVSDRPASLNFHVSDESGQPTRDYVALLYAVEKSRWTTARTFSPPPLSVLAIARPPQATLLPGPAAAMPPRRESMSGLRPGEYFVIAVDDMEGEETRDPTVLEKLRSSATRVTLTEGATADVTLRRISFSDAMAQR